MTELDSTALIRRTPSHRFSSELYEMFDDIFWMELLANECSCSSESWGTEAATGGVL